MNIIRKGVLLCGVEFRRWKKDYKLYLILILLLLFIGQYTHDIFAYAKEVQYPLTPWLLPFQMIGRWNRLIIYGCAVLYFSSVFRNGKDQKYQFLRSGHRAYLFGKFLYILLAAAIYALAVWLLTLLPHLNQIYLGNEWGKILGTWSRTPALWAGGQMPGSTYLIEYWTPMEAMGVQLLLLWLTVSMLGLLMFGLNSGGGSMRGVLVCGILTGVDYLVFGIIYLNVQAAAAYFSPLSWSDLALLDNGKTVLDAAYPPVWYAVIMGILVNVILITVIWILMLRSYRSGSKHQWIHLAGE